MFAPDLVPWGSRVSSVAVVGSGFVGEAHPFEYLNGRSENGVKLANVQ